MKTAVAVIAADKLRLALVLSAASVVVAAGVTFGSWAVSGSGNAYAKAAAGSLMLNDASASTVADLYPGGAGDVKVSITNTNPYDVTITGVTGNGTITSNVGGACDTTSGLAFTDQTGLSLGLGAGATTTFTFDNAASMAGGAPPACGGAVFTIPVSVAATT